MNNSTAGVVDVQQQLGADREYFYTVLVTGIQQIISVFGILFNCSLVYVTAKHRSLRTKSFGLLLAICSFCDFLIESCTFLATALVTLQSQISLLHCFYAQAHGIAGISNSTLNLLFISLDRLLAVAFPMSYRQLIAQRTVEMVLVLNLLSLTPTAYALYLAFVFASENPEIQVYCEPGDAIKGTALPVLNFMMMASTLLSVLVYICLWILLKVAKSEGEGSNQQQQSNSQQQATKRIFKSLVVIMAVLFGCWLANLSYLLVITFIADTGIQFLLIRLASQLYTISGSINAPVLYFCSMDYREAMQKEFPQITKLLHAFCCCCPPQAVHSTNAWGIHKQQTAGITGIISSFSSQATGQSGNNNGRSARKVLPYSGWRKAHHQQQQQQQQFGQHANVNNVVGIGGPITR